MVTLVFLCGLQNSQVHFGWSFWGFPVDCKMVTFSLVGQSGVCLKPARGKDHDHFFISHSYLFSGPGFCNIVRFFPELAPAKRTRDAAKRGGGLSRKRETQFQKKTIYRPGVKFRFAWSRLTMKFRLPKMTIPILKRSEYYLYISLTGTEML